MVSKAVQDFVLKYAKYVEVCKLEEDVAAGKLHVDEIASKLAEFYERVRGIVDYHEAHVLHKSIIERILRRRLFFKHFNKEFSEPLIKELIRAGNLPNDSVPEHKVAAVQVIINNLIYLLNEGASKDKQRKEELSDWLTRMFVSKIEEELFPAPAKLFLAEMMYRTIREHLTLKNAGPEGNNIDAPLFLAAERALFRLDKDQLRYALLKFTYPHWGNMDEAELREAAAGLNGLKNGIEALLNHPYGEELFKLCGREKIVFQLIGDMVFNNMPLAQDFDAQLKTVYEKRYQHVATQLKKLAIFSVISFFVSKMLVAFAVEIPIDTSLYHHISLITMAFNIVFPPLLMFAIVMFIRLPSTENFKVVAEEVRRVVSAESEKSYVVTIPPKRKLAITALIYLVYTALMFVVPYYLVRLLLYLEFSIASIVIFFFFTSMVIATGVKIKNRTKEMSLLKENVNVFAFLGDIIAAPFVAAGKFVIDGLARFNILVIALNLLIEAPLQFFVEFLENFRAFIKSKKEEVTD